MSDKEAAGAGGAEAAGGAATGRTFTEEQGAIFSNPHDTPKATRPRTPGTESVAPDVAETLLGGDDAERGEDDAGAGRTGKPLV